MSLVVRPITLRQANAFVELYHRHHKPARGCVFCISVLEDDTILRGVAIVGRPVARMLQDGRTCEVLRVCTDGTYNVCSKLYATVAKTARGMGYERIVTYTLPSRSSPRRPAPDREEAEVGRMTSVPNPDHCGSAYVAGRFSDWQAIREVQATLREHGYTITYDWTVHAEPKDARDAEWKGALPVDIQRQAALTDLQAARDADLLVLVCEGDMAGALGCYVEFGAAAVEGARIHVIGASRNSIFWHLPRVESFCSREQWTAVFGLRESEAA